MGYDYRVTAICTDADRDAMRRISTALGYTDNVFSAPMSRDGGSPATHWAYSTAATAEFVAMQTDPATQDHVLSLTDWTTVGLTEDQVRDVLGRHWSADPAMLMIALKEDASGREQLAVIGKSYGLELCGSNISINRSDSTALQALDGVGPSLAQAIIEGRPWADPADLAQIDGISAGMVEGWMLDPGLVT